eukprot:scaffold10291_cov293-Chaetoceros_neogracile.AAC.1
MSLGGILHFVSTYEQFVEGLKVSTASKDDIRTGKNTFENRFRIILEHSTDMFMRGGRKECDEWS